MIERLILWSVSNRFLVCAGTLAIALWGMFAMRQTPLDAVPDVSDVQVLVSTEWPGRSPDLIEDHITYPLVAGLVGAPQVRTVRAVTDFGVSFVYVLFEDATDVYWARTRVAEHLQTLRGVLPEGVTPTLAPDASGVGWVYQYAVVDESGRHTLDELRSLQDWTIRYALTSLEGVAEVASIGGHVKQYQVTLDPARLAAHRLSPRQVVEAIRASNNDVEGRLLEFAGREYMVRARGYLGSLEDIEQVAVRAGPRGTPLRVGDVADVRLGPDIRRGVADLNGRGEAVGGIVIMRAGVNALDVIDGVKARLTTLERGLPAGVTILPTYDRSQLIHGALGTLRRIVLEEVLLVLLVALLFLSSVRTAVIPAVVLPVAVLASFIPLASLGVTANIMSLGGIALAIGVLVDAAIVMVENGHRRVYEETAPAESGAAPDPVSAALQVGRAVFFSLAIILVSFAPVFLLQEQEGRMFRPLALTKTMAVALATVGAVTLVPVLMGILLRPRTTAPLPPNGVTRVCISMYAPILRLALRRKWTFLAMNAAVIPLTALLFFTLGHEFMPPLYEGALLYMPTAPAGLPVTDATRLLQQQDRLLMQFPEVERVFGTAGRATTATDNSPLSMVNTTILLKPRDRWRPGVTFEGLQAEMDGALQFAGFPNTWTQPIRNRLDMLFTGIKTPVGVKILGPDLAVIQNLGRDVERILQRVPGTRSAYAERVLEGSFTDIRINRSAIARHGLSVQDVEDVIRATIGGTNITHTIEGRERYPVNVRYGRDFRQDPLDLERVLVQTSSGAQVPLGQLAEIAITAGPAMIRNENGQLAGYVYVDPAVRDLGGFVANARTALDRELALPAGYRLDWSGQYAFQMRAAARLRVILPIVFVTIFVLLFMALGSVSEAAVVMISVVYAMTGGVLLQWLLGYNFSVAVWVGYIGLYGIAVQTGVIMVLYLHEALDRRKQTGVSIAEDDLYEATIEGAVLRLRPKLMTVSATLLGLLPILWSSGVGSDVLKPIAAPIAGGMITSTVHVLLITPILFFLMKRRDLRQDSPVCRQDVTHVDATVT